MRALRAVLLAALPACCLSLMVTARPSVAPHLSRCAPVHMNFFAKFLQELDNFADDAVGRRLGNGAKFYGKRKSSFYGEDDELRKRDPQASDASEDYSGPAGGSYFVLSEERDEEGRPLGFLTRKEARELSKRKEEERYEREAMTDSFRDTLARSDSN